MPSYQTWGQPQPCRPFTPCHPSARYHSNLIYPSISPSHHINSLVAGNIIPNHVSTHMALITIYPLWHRRQWGFMKNSLLSENSSGLLLCFQWACDKRNPISIIGWWTCELQGQLVAGWGWIYSQATQLGEMEGMGYSETLQSRKSIRNPSEMCHKLKFCLSILFLVSFAQWFRSSA